LLYVAAASRMDAGRRAAFRRQKVADSSDAF